MISEIGVISLFPDLVKNVFEYGINSKAVKTGALKWSAWNPRDFTTDRHQTVDDRPFGGGPGMLMKVEPLTKAIDCAKETLKSPYVVYLSPHGKALNHKKVMELLQKDSLLLISGRYEGIDQRVIDGEVDEQISIGDYVLSGGELASMVLIDTLIRQIPGVLGHSESAQQDSFTEGLLDCPHYTRPENVNGQTVPKVLLSGNHKEIEKWRRKQSLGLTWKNRPDLLEKQQLSEIDQQLLAEYIKEHSEQS
jgi:tRNA (guanine37-N1)-methyltransferase